MNGPRADWHTTEMARVKRLSTSELRFTVGDCREAVEAHPENPKCGQYADTIHYCCAELMRRQLHTGHKHSGPVRTDGDITWCTSCGRPV